MKFCFLIENKTDNPGIVAEHGLSIYIESNGKKILFDAGATNIFADNARTMGIDLSQTDMAVISHGHYDHTGGIPEFCSVNSKAPVYIHKNALRVSFGTKNGKLEDKACGIRWSNEELMKIDRRLVFTDGPVELAENIRLTGTVAIDENFRPTEKFCYLGPADESGSRPLLPDDMSHEQCLVVREPEGLYIFSGCSHRGAVNALNAGRAMYPGEKVIAFVAGMHLYSASDEDRVRVIREIASQDVQMVMPVHCTGIQAICDMKTILGKRCQVATAGDVYDMGKIYERK